MTEKERKQWRQRQGRLGAAWQPAASGWAGAPRQSEGQVSIVPYKEGVGPPFQPFFSAGTWPVFLVL